MSELLLELLSEEIPAMMQQKCASAYKDIFTKYFAQRGLNHSSLEIYAGPRRITLHVEGLDKKLPASKEEIKGPKINAPEAAITGFCLANNITKKDLSRKNIGNAEFYVYEKQITEKKTSDLLLATIGSAISEYVWPKSMYWGDYGIKWVRPLQNILCIFDGAIVPFSYGHLVANNKSFGHKFMSKDSFTISNFLEYKEKLEANFVILSSDARQVYIKKKLQGESNNLGLVLKEDEALLQEVAGLVEYPEILLGKINPKFLTVPSEMLVSAMRTHQKYFSLFDKNGNFAPYFLFVSNIISSDKNTVISGNEKVLSARLSDALYFYNQDLKTTLEEKSKLLEKVTFHAKLGSLKNKTLRISKITEFLAPGNKDISKAALICKSDIVSEAVGEFPELQGIMGYYYTKAEMDPDTKNQIAEAIKDHYKPQGPSDSCPFGDAAMLALVDKIDTLCGLIIAGEKPTGSKDPYALRRQSLGIIRIILENKLNINLSDLIEFTIKQYQTQIDIGKNHKKQILEFFEERLKYFLKDRYNLGAISASLDLDSSSNILDLHKKIEILDEFLSTEDGNNFTDAYKRISGILEKTNTKSDVNSKLFTSSYESDLYNAIQNSEQNLLDSIDKKDYKNALKALLIILKPLDSFFKELMVKDRDPVIAENRIMLMVTLRNLFKKIANFDKL